MEYNKSKWESKYEAFKNGNFDQEIEAMKNKLKEGAQKFNEAIQKGNNSEAQKAQDEINKLQAEIKTKEDIKIKIASNQAKIENTLQLKKDLIKETAELLGSKNLIQEYEKAKKYVEKNDKDSEKVQLEIEAIDVQIKQLNKQINNPNIASADKAKFEQDKAKLNNERQKKSAKVASLNSDEYINSRKKVEALEAKVGSYNKKDINKTLAENEKLIAKCDLIGKCLLNGKSMSDITVSLNNFTFTPNKDFAKKVSAMRDLYEKEERKVTDAEKIEIGKSIEEAAKSYEKAKKAIEEAKKIKEEYDKISNLPVPETPWYKKIPGVKQIVNFFDKKSNNPEKNAAEVKAKLEAAIKEVNEAKKEYYEKKDLAEKAQGKQVEIEKGRSIDYLSELRQQKDQTTALEGMTLYGDTFKDRLKFQMPNIKTSLTQDEIDRAKSMKQNQYVMPGHEPDKRGYHVEKRKNEIRKNIERMKGKTVEELKAEKKAKQQDGGRDI